MMKLMIVIGTVLLCSIPLTSDAVTKGVIVDIVRTLVVDDGRFGGCMVFTDVTFVQEGLDCNSNWVSFSCSGDFTSKDVGYRMFDSAQLAFVLGNRVLLVIDDTKKHNGYCYANRIDVLP